MSIPASVVRGWPKDLRESWHEARRQERIEREAELLQVDDFGGAASAYLRGLISQRLDGEHVSITKAATAAGIASSTVRSYRQRRAGFLGTELRAQHGDPHEPKPKPQATSYLDAKPAPPLNPWVMT